MRWVPGAALLSTASTIAVQAVGLAAFGWLWNATFGPERQLPEALDIPVAYAVLLGTGLAGAATACAGLYLLVRRAPLGLAAAGGVVCLASLTLSVAWLWSVALIDGWL